MMSILDLFTWSLFVFFVLTTINYILVSYPNFIRSRSTFEVKGVSVAELTEIVGRSEANFKINLQYTTRGKEMAIISEGLRILDSILFSFPPILRNVISVDIVTEVEEDNEALVHANFISNPTLTVVPKSYKTSRGTKLKARAMEYMLERKIARLKNEPTSKYFTVFLDAESVVDLKGLTSIICAIYNTNPEQKVLQGPIYYPRYWKKSNYISRQMECLRPWNCFECHSSTSSGNPYHLHGSNVVIRMDIEERIRWDFGMLDGYPLVAEDLLFGIKCYLVYGRDIFGWHGAAMYEQAPMTMSASVQQRIRWVRGALQASKHIKGWDEYVLIDDRAQRKIVYRLYFKVALYAIGFVPALFTVGVFLYLIILILYYILSQGSTGPVLDLLDILGQYGMASVPDWMKYLSLFGASLWLLTIQIGLYYNLKDSGLSLLRKILEHVVVLVVTPFATIIDTGTAFYTLSLWIVGNRKATWAVTPKSNKVKTPIMDHPI